ncbi:cytochrome c oxidase assembly protein [Opitutus terrae]|uniref:Membrane protein-like protein n=1 Tax=Opitutus terrae (strain DSM 11246 / JCM 15787 / PB90-1) TaxID=452637 RepID=B1ZMS3_OPITP|nr:cytochrome c oxidase assembly protein [Opitutus terrae]ACB75351.1 membrane protein-like protein [Opitutus terrae PB90-1]
MIDWRHWHNEPYLIGGLILVGWLWAICAGPLRARLAPGESFPRGAAWRFYSGLVIFYLAVGSPLDQIGERFLFSAHMLQHQLLVYPAAILVLLGLPTWMVDPLLATPRRQSVWRLLVHPISCTILYSLTISVWHLPALYDLALRHKTIHVLEHLMFFGAALLYWWPMLSPSAVLPPRRPGTLILYFLAVEILMTPIFAYVTFSQDVLYATYEYAPRILPGFSAADDQLLAGSSMKLVGMAVALGAIAVCFWRWYAAGERTNVSPPAAQSRLAH